MKVTDENLRLILATQEKGHIEQEMKYHKRSLLYCGAGLAGFLFYMMLYPLLMVAYPPGEEVYLGIGLIGLIAAFSASLLFIPSLYKYRKYHLFMVEHQKFMKKYNR